MSAVTLTLNEAGSGAFFVSFIYPLFVSLFHLVDNPSSFNFFFLHCTVTFKAPCRHVPVFWGAAYSRSG